MIVQPAVRSKPGLDQITRRWWFLVALALLFFLPSYSAQPYDPRNTPLFITAVLSNALVFAIPALYPLFKIIPLLLIGAVALLGNRARRAFNLYAAFNILLGAVLENAAFTPEYGFGVIVGNVVVYLIVAGFWAWEAVVGHNDFAPRPAPPERWLLILPALLAFWLPVQVTGQAVSPDFNPLLLLTSSAGLALCMMIPLFLAVQLFFYPTINLPAMRVTAFAGLITGLFNLAQWFVFQPAAWWMGVMHVPLVILSAIALVASLRRPAGALDTPGEAQLSGIGTSSSAHP